MARILTGIQSSGRPHLGNILGAIIPAIELSQNSENESFFFIADWHSLTSIKDAESRKESVYAVASAWLAFGFDISEHVFYRQSDIAEVAELTWYLNCFTPFSMLSNAHSFKDKSNYLSNVSAGLFTYPVLMAADILLYNADIVPVGKDQKQHLEMTRDIAASLNRQIGQKVLKIPTPEIKDEVMIIPGTDGRKMAKSYNNIIDIFSSEKQLKKQIMSIQTDSTPLEAPKNPHSCNVFAIYSLVAEPDKIEEMHQNYLAGGYGYNYAKKELLDALLEKYKEPRKIFDYYVANTTLLEKNLIKGANKARPIAQEVLERIKRALGF